MSIPVDLSVIKVVGPNESNVLRWEVTSRMGDDAFVGDPKIRCAHSKSGVWPQFLLTPDTPAEGNVWGIVHYQGQWYARTLHYLRPGQVDKDFPRNEWGVDRVALPMPVGWGPLDGETVGLFVSTRARYGTANGFERSDVVWLRYGSPGIVLREGSSAPPPPDVPPPDPPDDPGPIVIEFPGLDDVITALNAVREELVRTREEFAKGVKIRWK